MTQAHSNDPVPYGPVAPAKADQTIIDTALMILARRMRQPGEALSRPDDTKAYCRLRLGALEREVFAVLLLDAQHRMIEFVELFSGTLTQTAVYPREVVKLALAHNAAGVIFTHNHPSGTTSPSRADVHLTATLKAALALVDVRVLDHVVVSADDALSMVETGML